MTNANLYLPLLRYVRSKYFDCPQGTAFVVDLLSLRISITVAI
jgi:hypothetical protein